MSLVLIFFLKMKFLFENTFITFFILYLWLIKQTKANIEKEVFTSNVVKISEDLYKEILEWSEQEGIVVGLFTNEYNLIMYGNNNKISLNSYFKDSNASVYNPTL
jgi:hypothetical protein